MQKKEINDDPRRWKDKLFKNNPVHFPLGIPISFFREIEKTRKFIWKPQEPFIGKTILREKNNADLKLYYKAIVTKTEAHVHQDTCTIK